METQTTEPETRENVVLNLKYEDFMHLKMILEDRAKIFKKYLDKSQKNKPKLQIIDGRPHPNYF